MISKNKKKDQNFLHAWIVFRIYVLLRLCIICNLLLYIGIDRYFNGINLIFKYA